MKPKRALGVLAIVLAMMGALASCGPPEKILLRFRLKKGQLYRMSATIDQRIRQTIMSQEQSIRQKMLFTYDYDVKGVTPGGLITIAATIKRVTAKMEAGGQSSSFDSARPQKTADPLLSAYSALVGRRFEMTMAQDGAVKSIRGMDAVFRAMFGKLKSLPAPQRDAIAKALRRQFGDEAMKRNAESWSRVLPSKPIAVGDTWRKSVELAQGLPTVDCSWTLRDRRDGVAVIDVSATTEPNAKPPEMDMGNVKVIYALKGKGSGTMEMDESSGMPLKYRVTQKLSGTVRVTGPGMPRTMTWPMRIDGTVTMTTTKLRG